MLTDDLRIARLDKGWSQKTLADRIGSSAQAVMRLENGVGSAATLNAAMEALDFRLTGIGAGKTIGEQLRSLRKKRGLSLDRLAERAGLSRTTLSAIEQGSGSGAKIIQVLNVLAPSAKRRAPERAYWGAGDKEDRDSRFTPPDFMEHIYDAFGPIDLDPCAHRLSPVIAKRRIICPQKRIGAIRYPQSLNSIPPFYPNSS